jgi:hypothetical protein
MIKEHAPALVALTVLAISIYVLIEVVTGGFNG